jgi:hypothetical protein
VIVTTEPDATTPAAKAPPPAAGLRVTPATLLTGSLNVSAGATPTGTAVAAAAGATELTVGGVVSANAAPRGLAAGPTPVGVKPATRVSTKRSSA